MRFPLTSMRRAAEAPWFCSRGLAFIELAPMPNLVHNHVLAFDVETDAVITRAQAIPAGQVAGERLGAADGGPGFQAHEEFTDAFADDARQLGQLLQGIRPYRY